MRRPFKPPLHPIVTPDYREVLPRWKMAEFRHKYGLTQAGFAAVLGASPTSVCSWETGRTNTPKYIQLAMSAYEHGLPPLDNTPVEFRDRYGMTQAALGEAFGVTVSTVSSWERMHTLPPKYIQLAMSAFMAGLPPYNG